MTGYAQILYNHNGNNLDQPSLHRQVSSHFFHLLLVKVAAVVDLHLWVSLHTGHFAFCGWLLEVVFTAPVASCRRIRHKDI